jgi:GWxTD domain-containing protein
MSIKSYTIIPIVLLIIVVSQGCSILLSDKTFSTKDRILNDMYPILSTDQFNDLANLNSDDEIKNFIQNFWNENTTNGNVTKEEYIRRLEYANHHFADKYGWGRSDRKRIYLIYGPPVDIDRNDYADIPLTVFARIKAIEIWHYGCPGKNSAIKTIFDENSAGEMKFIFADMIGSGNYKILYSSENPGDIDSRILR